MQFAPETQILILNAAILAIAYLGIFPSLRDKSLAQIMRVDLVVSLLAIGVAAALFWGSGTAFNMIFFSANWAVFSIVTLMIMEAPLFYAFARKHGIILPGKHR
ncbi:hypothetical protein [Yoonia vestfoldensis]|uniref:Uncharacterized protein n=1 Tax=Yoonia vestfoldensis TaxID=245188 RepID=A0A1Y0EAX7_9RHOB|nr:hypothetical protein [Yoonia vestfoldensis]ARU00713.1 hypothetical protein LOKVESSMR4R_01394 [Yoonia vestfoldensis]